jgi:hypothetical protein
LSSIPRLFRFLFVCFYLFPLYLLLFLTLFYLSISHLLYLLHFLVSLQLLVFILPCSQSREYYLKGEVSLYH